MWNTVDFSVLVGKVLTSVKIGGDELIEFETSDGGAFRMEHDQDCCENVNIEDICGDLSGMVGQTVLTAYESSNEDPDASESGTWTFYNISTNLHFATIRWYGTSNGYYSESATFKQWVASPYDRYYSR